MFIVSSQASQPNIAGYELSVERWQEILSVLGNNRYLLPIVVVLASVLLAKIADWTFTRGLVQVTRRTHVEIDDQIVSLLHKPIFNTILLSGVAVALGINRLPEPLGDVGFGLITTWIVLLWLVFGMRLATLLITSMTEHPERFQVIQPVTKPLFEIAAKTMLIGGAVYFILVAWEIDATGWLTSAGIIGIAVGFAAKDTLANLFAGVFILADAPYRIGDFIVLGDGERGQVTKIGLRSTRILTRDDIEITIPNSTIANSKIINESGGPSAKHRLRIPVGVAYGSDVNQVRRVLQKVAETNEYICREPEPQVRLRAFGDSSLNFELLCWIEKPIERGAAQDSLNISIYQALTRARIEIPFPKRDVYIKQLSKESTGKIKNSLPEESQKDL